MGKLSGGVREPIDVDSPAVILTSLHISEHSSNAKSDILQYIARHGPRIEGTATTPTAAKKYLTVR